MRRSSELGLVETIYEADHEEEDDEEEENSLPNSASSFNVSPCSFPSSTHDLKAIVDGWSKTVGYNSDVVIRVYGDCFFLHKEPMASCSRYLRRRLSNSDDVKLCPPLSITVDAFTEIARFCYTGALILTPSNLAAVTVAVEMLEMEGDGIDGSAASRTEEFFRREIAGDEAKAETVLWSCVEKLPEGWEAAAGMAARCVLMLRAAAAAGGEDGADDWMVKLMEIPIGSFRLVIESMAKWSLHDHDELYRIADRYFGVNKERITEEEKLIICRSIDCKKVSRQLLLHVVQNPRLPLRFIFKAMLHPYPTCTTLGDLINRDAASRQASRLATRIDSLEHDIASLRGYLRSSEEKRLDMLEYSGRNGKGRCFGRKLVEGFRRLFG